MSSELPVKDFVSSAGDGLLFGAVVGYAIKKIAAVVVGLFVVGRPMTRLQRKRFKLDITKYLFRKDSGRINVIEYR